MVILVVLAHLACSYLAYRVFVWSWLRKFDQTVSDRRFQITLSLAGALSLMVAIFIAITFDVDGDRIVKYKVSNESKH